MKRKTALAVLAAAVTLSLGLTACGGAKDTATQPDTVIETETEAVIPEATETPETEAVVPEETELPLETETEEIIPESTESDTAETETPETPETPEIAVKEMSATKYAKSSVNVRKGPGTEYDKVGSLSTNQQVAVTGQAENGWYRIDMNGTEAFVSNKYLSDEKVAVNTAKGNNGAATGDAGAQQAPTDNAGAQQGQNQQSQPQNNPQPSQPQQSQTPPADNSAQTPPPADNGTQQPSRPQGPGILPGRPATPEETQDALNDLPDDATNVQVDENGYVSYDVPALKDQ